MDKLFVYTAGEARGDPGEAAIGVSLIDSAGNVVEEVSQFIGRTTTNMAGYRALIEGGKRALPYSPDVALFFTSNRLIVNQLNGIFAVRQPPLTHMAQASKDLLSGFPRWRISYIDPSADRRAPKLVNSAFHKRTQSDMRRSQLERQLLAQTSSLDEEKMRRLIEHARRLQEAE
jgi:ribonuclease HI